MHSSSTSASSTGLRAFDFLLLVLSLLCLFIAFSTQDEFSFQSTPPIAANPKLAFPHRRPTPVPVHSSDKCESTSVAHDCHELLLINHESELELHRFSPSGSFTLVRRQVLGSSSGLVRKGRRFLALAAGKLNKLDNRRQSKLIVAISENSEIFCFSMDFQLLWRKQIDLSGSNSQLFEASILIDWRPQRLNDSGSVIIGTRMANSNDLVQRKNEIDLILKSHSVDEDGKSAIRDDGDQQESLLKDGSESRTNEEFHYNYYAFDALTGDDRWRHESKDFLSSSASADILHPQHDVHSGEVDWRNFRHDLIHSLPHYWATEIDSHMKIRHFERTKRGRKSDAQNKLKPSKPMPFKKKSAVKQQQHKKKPANALVNHLRHGVEVIHLYSGRPLCQINLKSGETHIDINGDGVIDHIQTFSPIQSFDHSNALRSPFQPLNHPVVDSEGPPRACMTIVNSGVPSGAQLFNASICRSSWQNLFALHGTQLRNADKNEALEQMMFAPPLAIQSEPHRKYQTVIFSNSGLLTSLHSDGSRIFQTQTPATWSSAESEKQRIEDRKPSGGQNAAELAIQMKMMRTIFRPTVSAFPAYTHQPHSLTHFIVIGENRGVLIDASGTVVANFNTIGSATNPPILADVNGDGLLDVILNTPEAVQVVILHQRIGNRFALVSAAILVALTTAIAAVKLIQGRKKKPTKQTRSIASIGKARAD